MPIQKPARIASDPFKSAKWDEVTAGRTFKASDVPVLELLIQWYAVMEQCMDDITYDGSVRVAYSNAMGDIKALPQLSTMKQASAEIRAINKQLGIDDEAAPETKPKETALYVISTNRAKRAKDKARASAG